MERIYLAKKDVEAAASLRTKGTALLFSEGTYQIEIVDPKSKKSYWPFFQLTDSGEILDCFCTCAVAEKTKSCVHLAAGFLKIFNKKKEPLHVRFRRSLWNQLCQMAARRHGHEAAVLKQRGADVYEAFSTTRKKLFAIEAKGAGVKKRLKEILFQRPEETEETSLKFSNLSPEELLLWRQGRPSDHLLYELSFWSDLAKWWMQLQEEKETYEIEFSQEGEGPPKWIHVRYPQLSFSFYLAEANWAQIIPSVQTVQAPLSVHDFFDKEIDQIVYDPLKKQLQVEFVSPVQTIAAELPKLAKPYPVGEWLYVPGQGFFPAKTDPIFAHNPIPKERIVYVLQHHLPLVQKYLKGASLFAGSVKARYSLHFDEERRLHIACYVFEEGDLQEKTSAYFGPWVYVGGKKAFFLLEDLLFEKAEEVIAPEKLSDFLNRHRTWLNTCEGFQIHLSSLESRLTYQLAAGDVLQFQTRLDHVADAAGELIDFEDWVYVKTRGFYAKIRGRLGANLSPGLRVDSKQIAHFIRLHKEELEPLQGFFAPRCPLESVGVQITLDAEKKILVLPHLTFAPSYAEVKIFVEPMLKEEGSAQEALLTPRCAYTYVAGEGFYPIPQEMCLPDLYWKPRNISHADEAYFVAYELGSLTPFIRKIDPALCLPKEIFLKINKIKKDPKSALAPWIVDLCYETEIGTADLFSVWRALQENRRYLFSPAGLIVLKQARFGWLKKITKKRWLKGGRQLRLTTLEWMRLSAYESVRLPEEKEAGYKSTQALLEEFSHFHVDKEITLTGFKSDLRTYQELGVRWLWFLYCYGLSGLLCDEMGLGKTHQAMGLIAAVKNAEGGAEKKILVVCPTSVIYHWEELLKRFLPAVRVSVFYGTRRTLEDFSASADVLLTSYGTLRSEKKALSELAFDLAIFDEIQIAKNARSQTHKVLKGVAANMRLGLTGTPIENRLLELKALFDIVVPGYMPQESQFKELFVNPIEKHQDETKKALLMRLTRPFILRRKKTEVLLELPEKIEEIAYCALSDEQKELYRKTFLRHRDELLGELQDEKKPVPYLHVFSLLSTLKQICDHPCLISKDYTEFQKHKSGKWDLFLELLEETRESGQKLVVFSQYLDMLTMMENYLQEHKIGYAHIRGSTRDRKEQLEKFRDDPVCEVFLASLQAVGVGVDLVSASVVIHYDRWWNPARENQATDRVHRIGQNRGVQVFKMVTKGTIEEHIHALIEKKLSLVEGVIGFDEKDQIKGLDRSELLELLRSVGGSMSL